MSLFKQKTYSLRSGASLKVPQPPSQISYPYIFSLFLAFLKTFSFNSFNLRFVKSSQSPSVLGCVCTGSHARTHTNLYTYVHVYVCKHSLTHSHMNIYTHRYMWSSAHTHFIIYFPDLKSEWNGHNTAWKGSPGE